MSYLYLLYRHECFTGKYTTRKVHTKPHSGLEWRIFHILTSEDIADFTDINFVSQIAPGENERSPSFSLDCI